MNVIAIRQRPEEVYRPPENDGELGLISLKWIFSFLIRRWMLIGAVAIVVAIATFAHFALQPSRYTATAMIMLQGGQERVLAPEQMVNGDPGGSPPAIDTQLEVLRSTTLAEPYGAPRPNARSRSAPTGPCKPTTRPCGRASSVSPDD